MRDKATALRNQMVDVMERFANENPGIPAQVLMAGLGELVVQFSVSQVGPGMTIRFLDDLREAVQRLGQAH
ncbi:hypothetical protein HU755_24010 [Pseudomonas sp. SWRI111]|uniref:Uncharacterized protein n=1 Tax=Pseudomonas frederiksbergensis TaxID=104087 RepID=A0A0B1Z7W2_9PSED|nr:MULTISPECIES: hypothetical protein [Pseudomonas]KHK65301.1 hypothetical protein JZ00_09660 [Pseudomonas frederiksbergensis]MBC3209877.1 hypothetical protein [Pseudomonas sp. SWRI111]UVM72067.1 hypothetical protein LOY40_26455 [Pseudomonas canavaninivorans]